MEQEGNDHELAVTHHVREEAKENDGQPKAHESHAGDLAELGLRKAKIMAPHFEDVAANRETHAGSNQCQKTGPEQNLLIRLAHRVSPQKGAHRDFSWPQGRNCRIIFATPSQMLIQ